MIYFYNVGLWVILFSVVVQNMSESIMTFKRVEKKYLLSQEKYNALWELMSAHLMPDKFHHSTVCSIYYDNENYSLIRQSLEKPVFKEKLRVRSYNTPSPDGEVFIELKKKFKGVVYKRRVAMPCAQASDYLAGRIPPPLNDVTMNEIDWFIKENKVLPKVFIGCDRYAYVALDNPELRITFDKELRWREDRLDLTLGSDGELLTAPGDVLMEIKIPGAAPMWLARMLSDLEVFPTSFSKYGTAFSKHILLNYFTME